MENLNGIKVAILATDGFEESEFTKPIEVLENVGAEVHIISIKPGKIRPFTKNGWGKSYTVDATIDEVNSSDYDALVLPGGVMNPDKLRMNQDAISFVRGFLKEYKPVAAICHGPWTLIETGLIRDREVTSYPSLKTDLINAGAKWVDKEVVVDNGLVTSRNPQDLNAFCKKLVEEISEGVNTLALK